jgi:hypothetical protein
MTWSIVVISAAFLWLMIAIYVGVNLFPSEGEKNDL